MNETKLISAEDFAAEGIVLPTGFTLTKLSGFISVAYRTLLRSLSVSDHNNLTAYVADIDAPGYELTDRLVVITQLLRPYLVNSAWADYILEGSIIPTDTGLVEKQRQDSLTITDRHRAELRKKYTQRADDALRDLSGYSRTIAGGRCTDLPCSAPVRFGRAQGRTRSRFD